MSLALKVPFGKHRGRPISDVPTGYLTWLASLARSDWLPAAARAELLRRRCPDLPPADGMTLGGWCELLRAAGEDYPDALGLLADWLEDRGSSLAPAARLMAAFGCRPWCVAPEGGPPLWAWADGSYGGRRDAGPNWLPGPAFARLPAPSAPPPLHALRWCAYYPTFAEALRAALAALSLSSEVCP